VVISSLDRILKVYPTAPVVFGFPDDTLHPPPPAILCTPTLAFTRFLPNDPPLRPVSKSEVRSAGKGFSFLCNPAPGPLRRSPKECLQRPHRPLASRNSSSNARTFQRSPRVLQRLPLPTCAPSSPSGPDASVRRHHTFFISPELFPLSIVSPYPSLRPPSSCT